MNKWLTGKNRKIIIPVILLIVFSVVFNWMRGGDSGLLFTVNRADFIIDVKVDGELKALESFVIKAPSNIWGNARIVRLVPEGQMVKKDDFLIQFDTSEFQQRLMEATNKVETVRANLASTKANIKSQVADIESNIKLEQYSLEQSRLRAKNAIYESENKRKEIEFNLKKAEISYQQLLDKKLATQKINKATLRQAELEVEQALIKLKRAEDDLGKLTLLSPADGLVVYKEVWEGDKMGKLKVGYSPWRSQPLMEIPSRNKMKVSIKINEVDISQLALEQEVRITLDAVPDSVFSGRIKEIASLAHKQRRTRKNVFDVEVYLNETDERLKPGMTAHCRVIINQIENVLSVPIDAVQTFDSKTIVYDEDGDPREISTGLSNSDFIIVENGIKKGDKIRLQETKKTAVENYQDKKKAASGDSEESIMIINR